MIKLTDVQKSITNEELLEFETKFNVKLNETHKKLLLENNGGIPNHRFFDGDEFDYFLSIKYGSNSVLLDFYMRAFNDIPKGLIVFASGNGSVYAYDSAPDAGEAGKVYYVDESHDIEYIAPSFEYLLENMNDEWDV